MERVAFLLEHTGERLGCLLNPASLVRRRRAGIQPRRSLDSVLTGSARTDDALIYTGGGMTELSLDLLFDVAIAGSTIPTEDVRDLTEPLWNLSENQTGVDGYGQPTLVRFVWGKSWNMSGVVAAISERLESFTQAGVPRRSWLRMRFVRVPEPQVRPAADPAFVSAAPVPRLGIGESMQDEQVYEVVGQGDRPDAIAAQFYNDPLLWRLICVYNAIIDPLRLEAGQQLRIPPLR